MAEELNTIVLPDGSSRRLGNIIPPQGLVKAHPIYGEGADEPIIPRTEWEALVRGFGDGPGDPFLQAVHDQDGVGQCNCDATTAAAERERARQGLTYIELSSADLYERINGGSDRGSLLEDALVEMTRAGVGTAATAGRIWRRGMTTASSEERSRFKVLEYSLCPDFDRVFSAALKRRSLITGIMWYDNYKPGPDGWLPRGGGRGGGHAIMGFKPAMRMVGGQIEYGIWHRQSWGGNYNPTHDNCFVIPESAYGRDIGGWWALRSVVDEGGVVPAER